MDLKSILKSLKLNESTISMILGALVIVVVGVLVVNYFREKGPKGSLPFLKTGNKVEVTQQVLPTTHKVAKGENLWQIAEKYYGSGYNWVDIAKENKLANANLLAVNQELTIPNVEVRKPAAEAVKKPATTVQKAVKNLEPISGATYRVVKGDNLWNIAVRAYGDGYKWVQIAKENKLANPSLIHSGNILILPR